MCLRKQALVLKMEAGYQSAGAREADFQKLAQNTGTNIQKILQNGKTTSALEITDLFSTMKNLVPAWALSQ